MWTLVEAILPVGDNDSRATHDDPLDPFLGSVDAGVDHRCPPLPATLGPISEGRRAPPPAEAGLIGEGRKPGTRLSGVPASPSPSGPGEGAHARSGHPGTNMKRAMSARATWYAVTVW